MGLRLNWATSAYRGTVLRADVGWDATVSVSSGLDTNLVPDLLVSASLMKTNWGGVWAGTGMRHDMNWSLQWTVGLEAQTFPAMIGTASLGLPAVVFAVLTGSFNTSVCWPPGVEKC